MATYTPSTRIDDIGHKPPEPPAHGGGGDGRGGEVPDYGARLRRARLGLSFGIVTVCMVFISLTSAYIFRRGLPSFDGTSNGYVRDWGSVDLPWTAADMNTANPRGEQHHHGVCTASCGEDGGAGSGEVHSGNFAGRREGFSVAGTDSTAGVLLF